MASIYHLNQSPSLFWDPINKNLEGHPCFAPLGHRGHHRHRGRHGWGKSYRNEGLSSDTSADENTNPKGNMEGEKVSASDSDSQDNHHHRRNHHKKGKNGRFHGRSLRGKGGKEPYERGPHFGPYEFHGHGHNHSHDHSAGAGTFGTGHNGRGRHGRHGHGPHPGMYAFPGHHRCAGSFSLGPRRWGHHHNGGRGGHGKHHGGPHFGGPYGFLHQLGAGLEFSVIESNAEGVDFKPSIDVFDTLTQYIVHVSLPGAKKSDLSIDYDANESLLHMTGVVHRPGVNGDLHQALVIGERDRHVGVFEREVRLGTRSAPASVVVDRISAKLEDGILVVTLPKIGQYPRADKKKVVVEDGDLETEKDAMVVDDRVVTPTVSEASTVENDEGMKYVKVHVQ